MATLRDNCDSSDAFGWIPSDIFPTTNTTRFAQTITPTEVYQLTRLDFYANYPSEWSLGDPGSCYISLQETTSGLPNGSLLTEEAEFTVSSVKTLKSISFSTTPTLAIDTTYALVWTAPNAVKGVSAIRLFGTPVVSAYPSGGWKYYDGSWHAADTRDFNFYCYGEEVLPEKPVNPSPSDTQTEVDKVTANLTWEDGGTNADTFNIYFGTTSGALTELETGIAVGSPTWTSPMVVLEIKDYNPEATSGYRSPAVDDVLSTADDETTYTIWDVKRGDLVNTQYEAKLYAFRTGPPASSGAVLDNDVSPDLDNPQAVRVTLNDEWYFTGEVESAWYPYATRYYWRVDAVNEAGTTTGDEWYFDTQYSWRNERPPDYDATLQWQYTDGSYQWADIDVAGGGRYKQNLVIIGHNSIYFG
jgi:hypothetical protein